MIDNKLIKKAISLIPNFTDEKELVEALRTCIQHDGRKTKKIIKAARDQMKVTNLPLLPSTPTILNERQLEFLEHIWSTVDKKVCQPSHYMQLVQLAVLEELADRAQQVLQYGMTQDVGESNYLQQLPQVAILDKAVAKSFTLRKRLGDMKVLNTNAMKRRKLGTTKPGSVRAM